jgi:CRP-like cAMP-binding protein
MLYKLLMDVGQKTPRGVMISKKITHEDIANLTGLSRVSVSLALNVFEEMGILRKKRQMIEVFDMDRLRNIVSEEQKAE